MPEQEQSIRDTLHAHGLRSTPQRHAILNAFADGGPEHLSAEEIHARASASLTSLSRGTVYATLAEFTALGLLASFGVAEPVRYELNTSSHDHFRCRACRRLFDMGRGRRTATLAREGFVVERVETRAEGTCGDCTAYERGLTEGVRRINETGPAGDLLQSHGIACTRLESPLGELLLAATPAGAVRLAFEEHADVPALQELASSRRGSEASRGHLRALVRELRGYFAGDVAQIEAPADWASAATRDPDALRATRQVPYGVTRSYLDVPVALAAGDLAWELGANPLPLLAPCHRVIRGHEVPDIFVGGRARREWLLRHEREHGTATRDAAR